MKAQQGKSRGEVIKNTVPPERRAKGVTLPREGTILGASTVEVEKLPANLWEYFKDRRQRKRRHQDLQPQGSVPAVARPNPDQARSTQGHPRQR